MTSQSVLTAVPTDGQVTHRVNTIDYRHYLGESSYSCCWNGKLTTILTPVQEPPQLLCDLLKDPHFTQHIRSYNNALSFASLGTDCPPEPGPNFKIQGKLYHSIGSIGPPLPGQTPRFSQIYFYDTENEVGNRMFHQRKPLEMEVLESLQQMIRQVNPYVHSFKAALNICEEDKDRM